MEISKQLAKIRTFYRDELTDMEFYRKLSERVSDDRLSKELFRLSSVEEKHSKFWKDFLERNGISTVHIKPKRLKIRMFLIFHIFLGSGITVKLMEHGEAEAVAKYRSFAEASHDNKGLETDIEGIIEDEIKHEDIFSYSFEESEILVSRNRDIVLGMSDGLVEVLAALAGLTALITDHFYIALGGLVVAISGAISMSIGAYLSADSESKYRISMVKRRAIPGNQSDNFQEIKSINKSSTTSARNVGFFYIIGAAIPIIPYIILPPYYALVVSAVLVFLVQGFSNSIVALTMNIAVFGEALKAALLALLAAAASFAVAYMFHIFLHISIL